MAYPSVIAAALSGATVRQLAYWRGGAGFESLLTPEFYRPRSPVAYSFRDVVALRTFVYLRSHDVSLQRVRKAIRSLRDLGETGHLSEYSLVAMDGDVVWRGSDGESVDLTRNPGQTVIAHMVDIFGEFTSSRRVRVLPLLTPKPGVEVDLEIRGGYPVLSGTRVPFDVVAGLVADGLSPEQVADLYPSVPVDAVRGAIDFADYVEAFRAHRVSA